MIMDNNPEGPSAFKKIGQAIVAGAGVLALDGVIFAWDMQDKVNDIAIAYHIPPVVSGLTLITAAAMRWREVRHEQSGTV